MRAIIGGNINPNIKQNTQAKKVLYTDVNKSNYFDEMDRFVGANYYYSNKDSDKATVDYFNLRRKYINNGGDVTKLRDIENKYYNSGNIDYSLLSNDINNLISSQQLLSEVENIDDEISYPKNYNRSWFDQYSENMGDEMYHTLYKDYATLRKKYLDNGGDSKELYAIENQFLKRNQPFDMKSATGALKLLMNPQSKLQQITQLQSLQPTKQTSPRKIPINTSDIDKTKDYKVLYGDSLSNIAQRSGVSVDDIVKYNNIKNKNFIREGLTLRFSPQKTVESTEETPTESTQQTLLNTEPIKTNNSSTPISYLWKTTMNQSSNDFNRRMQEMSDLRGWFSRPYQMYSYSNYPTQSTGSTSTGNTSTEGTTTGNSFYKDYYTVAGPGHTDAITKFETEDDELSKRIKMLEELHNIKRANRLKRKREKERNKNIAKLYLLRNKNI